MKKLLIALVLLVIPTSVALASHAWSVYHWRSDNLSPSVTDRTKGTFYNVDAAAQEWAASPSPIAPGLISKNNGNIKVSEATSNFWLGLARVFLDEDGHITKGEVKLNTMILSRPEYGPDAADHVLCQELGHILGLDHQPDSDSCMNGADLGDYTSPNAHDFNTLLDIYADHDGDAISDDDGPGGGPPCSKNPKPGCRAAEGWVIIDIFPIPEGD